MKESNSCEALQEIMKISNQIIQMLKGSVTNDEFILNRARFDHLFNQLVKINNIAHKETIEMTK
jgi:hypothetical protein